MLPIVLEGTSVDEKVGSRQPLNETDFENGDKINLETEVPEGEDPIKDAIENGNLFEGDILLNKEQAEIIENETEDRSAITVPDMKWKKRNGNVIVGYTFRSRYNSEERANIARAISEIAKHTCIRY